MATSYKAPKMIAELETTDRLLVSPQEARRLLGLSETIFREMRKAGEIPTVRVRPGQKGLKFSVETLRQWIKEREHVETVGGEK